MMIINMRMLCGGLVRGKFIEYVKLNAVNETNCTEEKRLDKLMLDRRAIFHIHSEVTSLEPNHRKEHVVATR